MSWDQIAALAEVLGALGVIASVLYLAFQIKGERDATLANTRQLRQTGVRESLLALATSDHLAPIFAQLPTGLTFDAVGDLMQELGLSREEAVRLNAYFVVVFRQLETNLRMPMTEEETEQTYATIRVQIRGAAGVWWCGARPAFSSRFVDIVDEVTRDADAS